MSKRNLVLILGVILLVGIGSYAACSLDVMGGGETLGGGAVTPDDTMPVIDPDAGMTVPPATLETSDGVLCGGAACAEGERCCITTGECYAATCTDCCPTLDVANAPEIERPNPEELPREGLAGPQPPPGPVGEPSPIPTGVGPGPNPGPPQ
ncbi:MAG: hypothetical protein IT378_01675 [Sandaracinaceae bacterium]|nr:hypothetical protein [Sandaracinaceae bacterium]MCC6872989.1 hypothetical protein [Sandaracinaceae bacterium]